MPSTLPAGARCPKCEAPLVAIVRTTNSAGVTAEYFHEREPGRDRRRRRCVVRYADPLTKAQARLVMKGLSA